MDAPMEVEYQPDCAPPQAQGDECLPQDAVDLLLFDKNGRRSSLGADSVLDQDFSEEGCPDNEQLASLTPLDAVLGQQYADEIFCIRRASEDLYHPTDCMAHQPQVTEHMRCMLVHWLLKVNRQLHFGQETVFLAINLADRFLALTPLAQDCLQLLAVSTLFLAAKMEESVVPGISELVAICGSTYKHHHFRRMEVLILSKLQFSLYSPTSWYFLDHLALKVVQVGTMDRRSLSVARYVLETCQGSYQVTQRRPSVQAAAAMLAATTLVHTPPTLSHTIHQLLCELYKPEEGHEATVCSSIMCHYMEPFLEPVAPNATQQHHHNYSPGPQPPAADITINNQDHTPHCLNSTGEENTQAQWAQRTLNQLTTPH